MTEEHQSSKEGSRGRFVVMTISGKLPVKRLTRCDAEHHVQRDQNSLTSISALLMRF